MLQLFYVLLCFKSSSKLSPYLCWYKHAFLKYLAHFYNIHERRQFKHFILNDYIFPVDKVLMRKLKLSILDSHKGVDCSRLLLYCALILRDKAFDPSSTLYASKHMHMSSTFDLSSVHPHLCGNEFKVLDNIFLWWHLA